MAARSSRLSRPAGVPARVLVRVLGLAGAVVVVVLALGLVWSGSGPIDADAASPVPGPVGRLGHDGRWLVDAEGRVVQLHGVNFVPKWPAEDPQTPDAVGFGADDAAFIRSQGWNVVRLGFAFNAIMPTPGTIDHDYVDSLVDTAEILRDAGLYVQLDAHQDGYGPFVHGNGFPEWATITDGLPNPPATFPLYYIQNPALQRAFDNFWENELGPDGVPLQDHYAEVLRVLASEVGDQAFVLGYDTMNEPWPGTNWSECATPGCPALEQTLLAPFAERMVDAIRSEDDAGIVFSEPFVLFNFGLADTEIAGFGAPASGLSFHVYALTPEEDEAVMDRAIAADSGDALLVTEFGATNDVAAIERLTGALDERLLPWIYWAYDEHVVHDLTSPPTGSNLRLPVVEALARPYASATNGTPSSYSYDPETGVLDYAYEARRPDGAAAPDGLTTVIEMPSPAYPDGYTIELDGAALVSEPDAAQLVLCNDPGVEVVEVRIVPGSDPDPPEQVTCEVDSPPSEDSGGGASDPASASRGVVPATVAAPVSTDPRFTG